MTQEQNNIEIENNLPAGTAVVVSDRYRSDRFFVWYNDAYRIVLCSNIAWLQADRDYCYLHFKNGTKMLVVHPLKDVLAMLPPEDSGSPELRRLFGPLGPIGREYDLHRQTRFPGEPRLQGRSTLLFPLFRKGKRLT